MIKRKLKAVQYSTEPKNIANRGTIFILILIAYFLDVIDFSIVQVALPTIRDEFVLSLVETQWIIGAYGITLAGFLMLSGRAGDIYGQKKLFTLGIVLFTIASLAGGLAPSFSILVIFRALQGIGAAMSTVTALAILIELFPEGKERNKALGIFVAILSAGFAAGSIAGGILTVLFGWRSVMFVNVPIGFIAAIASWKLIPSNKNQETKKGLDLPGAVSVTSGLILLIYSLTNIGNYDFSLIGTILPLILSIIILTAFFFIESRSKFPLIPLEFLWRGSMLRANMLGLILASIVGGTSFIVTIYLQQILNYSALYAGLGILPGALIFFFIGGWGATWAINRFGAKKILVASTLLITGGVALLTGMSVNGNYFGVLPGMLTWSLGASLGFPALNIIAFSGIKHGEEGIASGFINTSFRIGFPLGLAILLTITGLIAGPVAVANPSVSPESVVNGFRYALIAAALLGLIAFFVSLKLKAPKQDSEKSFNL
jgi:MFS family permease